MTKRLLTRTALVLALALGLAYAAPAKAGVAVRGEVGFFYDTLAPYGSWVNVSAYGDVWVPRVSPWWRPYSEGHWVFTDDGWCWVDDEPWGWATFHYGRWFFDSDYGWAWVPGQVWAPAWVAWRWGDGFVGWAPLPPEVGWRAGFGLAFAGGDFDAVIAPHNWCFVDERHFAAPRLRGFLAPTARNVTFMRATRNVTSYTVVNNRVVDRGIDVRRIETVTGRAVPRMRLVDHDVPGPGRVRGRDLTVYRPPVTGAPARWRDNRVIPQGSRGVVAKPRVYDNGRNVNMQQFQSHWNSERGRLLRQQQFERSQAVHRVNPNDLRQRHDAELRALSREQQRERVVLQRRLQTNNANVKDSKGKGKGNGNGNGHGRGPGND